MIARRVAPLSLVLAVLIAGCATQADIQELEREQRRLRTQMADTRAGFDSMQRDVAKVRGESQRWLLQSVAQRRAKRMRVARDEGAHDVVADARLWRAVQPVGHPRVVLVVDGLSAEPM